MIDLYVNLNQPCNFAQHLNWEPHVLNQVLTACEEIKIGHLWIGIFGKFLQDINFFREAQKLVELQQKSQIEQVTLQLDAGFVEPINNLPQIFSNFHLSLIICESPRCGIAPPYKLIRTYLKLKAAFRSVLLVGPSPVTCVFGLDAGAGIRRKCLVQPNQLFILTSGQVQVCPLGYFLPIGDVTIEPLQTILSRYQSIQVQFPVQRFTLCETSKQNVCVECFAKKRIDSADFNNLPSLLS